MTRWMCQLLSVLVCFTGLSLGSLASLLVTDPAQILELGDFVPDPTFTYQVHIPHTLLATDPTNARIELLNLHSPSSDLDLVAAFDFRGGHQEYLAVVSAVPEAATFILVLSGLLVLFSYAWRPQRERLKSQE